MRDLLVVVPAWNEEAAVGAVVREVHAVHPDAEVLVVDDGSEDDTAGEAHRAGATVLRLPVNLGVGGAMRTGYRYAARQGHKVVVQVDGDGQHDPAEIARLLDALDGADVVIGARFAGKGDYEVKGPRRLAMRMLAFSLSRIAGTRLTDATSGFRALNRAAIELFAAEYPAEYLGDTVEALVIAARAGLRIRQVPVVMRPRETGTASQSAVRATIYLLRAGLVLGLARIRRRPVVRRREP